MTIKIENTMNATVQDIVMALLSMADEKQRQQLQRFFKTGKGQYGEGDQFMGLKVPQTRMVVKHVRRQVALTEIEKLLYSPWHEARLCGLLLLVEEMNAVRPKSALKYQSESLQQENALRAARREQIATFYLQHARQANNWDLVDLSCSYIVGQWLLYPSADGTMPDRKVLDELSASDNLWLQRIAIVSTLLLIRNNQFDDTLRIATRLLSHKHDLIHKAVGWMLREVGKRNLDLLRSYLTTHHAAMARTTLRYAIEKMNEDERQYWLNL